MTDIPYHRIASRFYNRPLCLQEAAADTISAFLLSRIGAGPRNGTMADDDGKSYEAFSATPTQAGAEIHAPRASRFYGQTPLDETGRPLGFRRTAEGVGIITIVGELVNRGAWIGASSGLISYEGIKVQLQQAQRDSATKSVILDIESPGGEAIGAFEVAALVREVAKSKPIVAVANGMAASAAYAIASGASQIAVPPTGLVGSIGVIALHLDFSKFLEEEGITPTLIFAGAHKADGNAYQPLPDAVRADWQAEIEDFYAQFVAGVAAGRKGLSEERIRATEARMFKGQAAVAAGLADTVATFEDVLAELSRGSSGRAPSSTSAKGQVMDNITGAPAAEEKAGSIDCVAKLTAAYPELCSQISTAAATAERSRIAGIEALAVGHEDLAATCKADPSCTPEIAAWRMLQADKAARQAQMSAVQNVEKTTGTIVAAPVTRQSDVTPKATTPDGWKAEYEARSDLQAEFGSAEAYVAYQQGLATGKIKILNKQSV